MGEEHTIILQAFVEIVRLKVCEKTQNKRFLMALKEGLKGKGDLQECSQKSYFEQLRKRILASTSATSTWDDPHGVWVTPKNVGDG